MNATSLARTPSRIPRGSRRTAAGRLPLSLLGGLVAGLPVIAGLARAVEPAALTGFAETVAGEAVIPGDMPTGMAWIPLGRGEVISFAPDLLQVVRRGRTGRVSRGKAVSGRPLNSMVRWQPRTIVAM